MVKIFQDQDACTFADDKAVSSGVKRNRRLGGIGLPVQGGHVVVSPDAEAGNRRFGAAGDAGVKVTILDRTERFADRMGAGRTGGRDAEIGAHGAEVHRHLGCRHVGDDHGDSQRRDAGSAG